MDINIIALIRDELSTIPWTEEGLYQLLHNVADKHSITLTPVARTLRVCLTGSTCSPPLIPLTLQLGREEALKKVSAVLNELRSA